MDNLRWWLVVVSAVLLSLSGCASPNWPGWQTHPWAPSSDPDRPEIVALAQ